MDAQHFALLKLHLTSGIGRTNLFRLHQYFEDFTRAVAAPAGAWRAAGLNPELKAGIPEDSDPVLATVLKRIAELRIRIISYWEPGYPDLLRQIHDPPALLYLRGAPLPGECFAIVGSRKASQPGMTLTQELAVELARHDICVVSGLARGIDSAAHRGALSAEGRTIAVLGCGVDITYPPENRRLFDEILRNNTIISEYPPGTPPLAGHFPGRNRIISGLSKGVLIVEASEKSGSLITGDFAIEQGRELFAIPGALHSPNSRGTNRLLKEGAQLVTETADILHLLWPQRMTVSQQKDVDDYAANLPEPDQSVFLTLGQEPLHSDEIARKCGLTPMELSAILLDLELQGRVQALPGHHYIRNRL